MKIVGFGGFNNFCIWKFTRDKVDFVPLIPVIFKFPSCILEIGLDLVIFESGRKLKVDLFPFILNYFIKLEIWAFFEHS